MAEARRVPGWVLLLVAVLFVAAVGLVIVLSRR
jgi:hypothetical protein